MGNFYSKKINPFHNKYALGIIDIQNDFFKGGSLEVPNAEEILAPINKLRFICNDHMPVFFSQDCHPHNHISFASEYDEKPYTKKVIKLNNNEIIQVLLPTHCVKNTVGYEIHKDIIITESDVFFEKGTIRNIESYSAFGDECLGQYEDTGLRVWLIKNKITDIIIVGIATDFSIYNTVLDANSYGFKVHLILSCICPVDNDNSKEAIKHISCLKDVRIYYDVNDFYLLNKDKFMKNPLK